MSEPDKIINFNLPCAPFSELPYNINTMFLRSTSIQKPRTEAFMRLLIVGWALRTT